VAAGLGMRTDMGLVGLGVASRGRGEDRGDERVAISAIKIVGCSIFVQHARK